MTTASTARSSSPTTAVPTGRWRSPPPSQHRLLVASTSRRASLANGLQTTTQGLLASALSNDLNGLAFKARRELALENVALRQQLAVLRRSVKRPRLSNVDREFWVLLRVLPLLSVGEMTLRLYAALNYSHNSSHDLRRVLNGAQALFWQRDTYTSPTANSANTR